MEKEIKEIKVNNYTWKIKMTTEVLTNKSGDKCKSIIDYKNNSILLNCTLLYNEDELLHAIRHELTHLYIYETQLELKKTYSEEEFCELVALYGNNIILKSKSILKCCKKYKGEFVDGLLQKYL